MLSAPQLFLLLQLLVRQGWDVIGFSPGAIDGETWLCCDLLLT
jgi:hypothetical protein